MNSKYIILYLDTLDIAMEHLNDAELSELFKCIYAYHKGQNFEPTSSSVKMVFPFFKNQFDRNIEKYEEILAKRREAGRRGGLAKAANASIANQMLASPTNTNNNTVTDTETEIFVEEIPKEVKKKPVSAHHADYDWIDPALHNAFAEFLDYKKREKKGTYKTEATVRKAYESLFEYSNGNPELAIKVVDQAIAGGWMGLAPLKNQRTYGAATQFERNANSQQQLACDLTEYYRNKREQEYLANGQG